jgi:polyphosphate glucokinase
MKVLGIDIGGSGIKGAPVDVTRGRLVAPRFRLETPPGAKPDAMSDVVAEVAKHFRWKGRIGSTFPAVIRDGKAWTATNIDRSWIGRDVAKLLRAKTGCPVEVLNDADAAGLAEVRFGAARNRRGVVLILTFGSGIGSALFLDGKLIPNTELGQLEMHAASAEWYAADAARKRKDLRWKEWADRVNEYLQHVELLLSPDVIILGGGVSAKADKFVSRLRTRCKVVPARLGNQAGIVGAALAAASPRQRA